MREDKAKKFADKRASGAAGPKGPRVGLNGLDDIRTTPTGMQDGRGHMTKIKGEGTRMTQYDNAPKIRDGKKGQKQTLSGDYSVDRVALQRLLNAKHEGGARPNYYEDGPSKKKSSGSHQMPNGSMMRGQMPPASTKSLNAWDIMKAQEEYQQAQRENLLRTAEAQGLEQSGRNFATQNNLGPEFSNPQQYQDIGSSLAQARQLQSNELSPDAVNWAVMAAEGRRKQEEQRQWLLRQQMLQNYRNGSYA